MTDTVVTCENCGNQLDIADIQTTFSIVGIVVTPCEFCLEEIASEFLELSDEELDRRRDEYYHYK